MSRTTENQYEHEAELAALQEIAAKYRTLFEAAGDAIFLARATGEELRFTDCNHRALQMYRATRDQMVGKSPFEFSPPTQANGLSSRTEGVAKIRDVLAGKPQFFEWQHRRADGTALDTEVTLNRVDLGEGVYVLGIVREITERKEAEGALRTADRLAAMGTVVAGVAHEINTPLTTVCGLAELLAKDQSLGAEAREYANAIVDQAHRCAKTVEDLLGFARARRLSLQAVQVNSLIKKCVDLCRRAHRFDDVEMVEEYDATLPETMADRYRLEQVFINIIRNARDVLGEVGSVKRLTIRTECFDNQIRVEFTDTGPGISDPNRVFDPFYTTKVSGEGTGLGLSVSLGIAQEHGGLLTAENTEEGARFVVTLPVRSR